jgi:hypothetical protein
VDSNFVFSDMDGKGVVLRGAAECLAINMGGNGTLTGAKINVGMRWTEE